MVTSFLARNHTFAGQLAGARSNRWRLGRLPGFLVFLLIFTMNLGQAQAASASQNKALQVSVDRHQMHEDGTLKLQIVGDVKLSLSFGNLWNLNSLQLPHPDLGNLEHDFQIVGRNQSYNIKSINGNTQAQVTWTYTLSPKQTGKLVIPAIHYKGASSSPITITVLPGSGGTNLPGGNSGPVSVKLTVDQHEAYVQQQIVVTEELDYTGPLFNGNLDDVNLNNAIVQQLGQPDKFTRTRNGQLVHVIRRQYAVFPQKEGTLTIPAENFSGQTQDPITGAIRYIHAHSEPVSIKVKPAPSTFKGSNWLPATSLLVTDKFSEPLDQVHVGDSITRTIQIKALGQLDSALPPLNLQYPGQLKSYPDQPKLHSQNNNGTLESTRIESVALVPTQPGTITLPAVTIPWWDTVNDVERYAKIPAKTVQVLPASGQAGATSSPQPAPAVKSTSSSQAAPTSAPQIKPVQLPKTAGGFWQSPWFWVVLVLALGWMATLLVWWREKRRARTGTAPSSNRVKGNRPESQDNLYRRLRDALLAGDANALVLLPQWAQRQFRNPALQSTAEVRNFFNDPELSQELDALERHLYADPENRKRWQGETLVNRLDALAKRHDGRKADKDRDLPPLYAFDEPNDRLK